MREGRSWGGIDAASLLFLVLELRLSRPWGPDVPASSCNTLCKQKKNYVHAREHGEHERLLRSIKT